MTLHRFTILPLFATLTLLASACDLGEKSIGMETGADNGDGDGDATGDGDGDGDGVGACGEETLTIITDHAAALPHFDLVVEEYITIGEGTFLGDFSWLPNDGPLTNAHAETSSPLTMTVTYDGGEVRLTEVEYAGEFPNGQLGGIPCSNTVEIDVTLDFATEDGLFAESFEVPIRVYSHDEFSWPGFYFSVDLDAQQGDLAVEDFVYEDGNIEDFILIADFGDDTITGSFNIEVRFADWVGFGTIGQFSANRQP
jgi:hypothetical protein